MSDFHYCRTVGDDGGVDAFDGEAYGIDLESLLRDGLPPFNVALQIIAGLCEILDIAEQDNESHGDLSARDVFVEENGSISLEGFGKTRKRTIAPEGTPKGSATDLYGLGRVAFQLLCPHDLPELPDDDPDAHDDAVIDQVLLINLQGMPEEFHGDVQWFIAKLMAFDREDRPPAVDAWRTFIAFANATEGPGFVGWCEKAVDGGGERRDQDAAAQQMAPPPEGAGAPPEPTEEEDLGGPVLQSGPLASGLDFGGSAAKGQATAFWSKDAMKAALDADEDEEARPAAGGGAATAFWTKEQMQAMSAGSANAPRPKRKGNKGERATGRSGTRRQPVPERPDRPKPPPPKPQPPPPQHQPPPQQQQQPPPVISGPQHQPPPPAQPAEGGPNMVAIVGVIGVLLLGAVACLGLGGIGTLAAFLGMGGDDEVKVDTTPKPKPKPSKRTRDTGKDKKTKKGKKVKPKPGGRPRPKPRPGGGSSNPKPKPKPARPKPKPAPTPTGGPAKISFRSNGRGDVSCGGAKKKFDGIVTIRVDEFQLPATCLVTIGSGRGVFQVFGSGTVTCNEANGNVTCNPPQVP